MANKYISATCLDQHLTRDFTRISALSVLTHVLSPQLHSSLLTEQFGRETEMHMGWTQDHIYFFINAFCALTRKLL
ncbi:hypothetical protein KAM448_04460 [Aeromonas caviae]|uniref:Uncharacterized protein n=1 Tax=Aeromonas caviae TaxID=648 RepID=A0ABD0B246_AERCA|nr:hypothetical protein KAM376_32370 [Aeromonas caviae]GJA79520.1 hypothetical protein KAM355_00800 [Aeromonas caviae]GJA96746.1 hypothetical protein KAM359_01540 [Aeromonas caviae]GJB09595.1 hypothetical protein KAM362_01550 [Aeromonas caviae]GJB22395.1 hypothetical protein KAM365_01450 [Aeromonas caviae]